VVDGIGLDKGKVTMRRDMPHGSADTSSRRRIARDRVADDALNGRST